MSATKHNSVTPGLSGTPALALSPEAAALKPRAPETAGAHREVPAPAERGGPKGPEPTRYGDWERKGRCSDF